jgi:hypothetical protein
MPKQKRKPTRPRTTGEAKTKQAFGQKGLNKSRQVQRSLKTSRKK